MNQIRRATKQDISGILNLLLQVDLVHHKGRPDLFMGPATKYGEEELLEIISQEETPVFVCVDEQDRVLGHAFCIRKQIQNDRVLTDVRTLYIDDICVDEKARNAGIGAQLYAAVHAYAKEKGFYNLTLNVWCCNPGAMQFYEKMGLLPQKVTMECLL